MKKGLLISFLCLVILLVSGCSKYKAYTYEVDTGDTVVVKVTLDEGYDILPELPFTVVKNGDIVLTGEFLTKEGYELYANNIAEDSRSTIIEENENKDIKYIFYSNNEVWYYIVSIKDGNTGLRLENKISEESAKEAFNNLSIYLD